MSKKISKVLHNRFLLENKVTKYANQYIFVALKLHHYFFIKQAKKAKMYGKALDWLMFRGRPLTASTLDLLSDNAKKLFNE